MPNFQGAMNTMLGMAATAAVLNPDLKAERDAKTAERKAQKLEEAYKGEVDKANKVLADPKNSPDSIDRKEAERTVSEANKAVQEAREEALSKNPTAKRAESVVQGSKKSTIDNIHTDAYRLGAKYYEDQEKKKIAPTMQALFRGVSRDEAKMEEANDTSQKQVRAKTSQRRNFNDYLAKMSTSMGGTVGELPKEMQRAIASQYLAKDRKKIMDEEDRKGGKK